MYQHILVAVDGSDLSIDTASKAVRLAKSLGARVTFLHARADFGATDQGALVRVMSPGEFAQQAAGSASAILAKVEIEARASGISYQLVAKTSDRPYEVIIDTAQELACDLIFMASHGRRGLKGLLVGSQTQKVLAHTTIPVLVSAVESNSRAPEMDAAISIIKGEHRSLAAVMNGLKQLIAQARTSDKPVNVSLVRAMLFYFRNFPEALHHPKEESCLFSRIRGLDGSAEDVLAQLEVQHAQEPGLVDAIERALSAYEKTPDVAHLDLLAQATDGYCEQLWAHMSIEEKVILPICQERFSSGDWSEILQAFEKNGDPRFDKDSTASFDDFLARIMNMATGAYKGQ